MDSQLTLCKKSHSILKPKIRIVHIFTPEIIKTDPSNFRQLVQLLTGKPEKKKKKKQQQQVALMAEETDMENMERLKEGEEEQEEERKAWTLRNSGGTLTDFVDVDDLFF
ncbi:hypothetical protein IEQ34_017440 [Dendrobium chrysotoxum]|uniref:VQ domain-containing protein n=1 Tax=Dendrobium chrysotoxum TaxID=161865 RepID=A0AAV7G9M2_DENCH|nr:hypothetical protein IEQ34_017440 [Dendrobium chrysotoxum]